MPAYYAHTKGPDESDWHVLKDHLLAVAEMAAGFAGGLGWEDHARAAGLLHDLGKYSAEFQRRLRGGTAVVDHSTAGAREAVGLYGTDGLPAAYAVAGHHAGLPDYGGESDPASLHARLHRGGLPDYSAFREDGLPFPGPGGLQLPATLPFQPGFGLQFFTRMLFSCLADADYLDTEAFYTPDGSARRVDHPGPAGMEAELERHLARFDRAPATGINRRRAEILQACRQKAGLPPGIFVLAAPPGGGKTLSSLAFALRHAARHDLPRVVYVAPFAGPAEEAAGVFRRALGERGVLEHQGDLQYPAGGADDEGENASMPWLAAENWDAPLVVTDGAEFFESLFSDRGSRCRKLHNLARSVVILDEVRALPDDLLSPCLAVLWELAGGYGCTVLLCTAARPGLTGLPPASVHVEEIMERTPQDPALPPKVSTLDLGPREDDDIISELRELRQVLCIVNGSGHARILFEPVRAGEGAYYLASGMCPAHRAAVLAAARRALGAGGLCRLIATPIAEGADIDFPVVYRSLAGIDSLVRAAGRCNREGLQDAGRFFIFAPASHPSGGRRGRAAAAAREVLREIPDPLSPEALELYYANLRGPGNGFDRPGILRRFEDNRNTLAFPFAGIAAEFHLDGEEMVPVVIPWDEDCRGILAGLDAAADFRLLRRLQRYTIRVGLREYQALNKDGAIRAQAGGVNVLQDMERYDEKMGILKR